MMSVIICLTICLMICPKGGPLSAGHATAAADAAAEAAGQASAAYAEAYNKRDFQALAGQWTEKAVLIEGGARVVGREAIIGSIRGWLERHPQATLQIKVTDVELMAAPLARVRGVLQFSDKPGEKPVQTQFDSLRVLEDGVWRLAESFVATSHATALDELAWLCGTWQATDAKTSATVESTFERVLGGHAIVGRTKVQPKTGAALETLEWIQADRAAGVIRVSVLDSTGAAADGVIESDGTTFNRTLVGVPGESVGGRRAKWVQAIVPGGEGRFAVQSIERLLDGRPVPDGESLHFRKIK